MEKIYLIIVIILFILALSDLIVGVSNDAVNFLNSAIGSKVAPMWIILLIASIGIVVGATFSNGMMEVARNGIFNPSAFSFANIMIIFLAVMITDVLLLDMFNTFGLPTSTTVSVVFELLGAAVGMAIINIRSSAENINDLGTFINSERALLIITGILLSVVISFAAGILIQYIARALFSFNLKNTARYFGALWGGLAITGITYFILIKGAKGSSFISDGQLAWITGHTGLILAFSFVAWTALLQLLHWFFRVNAFKVIVLFGTFALAMAFAGNDLVNFIGVPLAGFESFRIFSAQQLATAGEFSMTTLMGQVRTPTFALLMAGLVMTLALWFSRKARTVTRTEINLGNQDLVNERFSSSLLARSIVRIGMWTGRLFTSLVPEKARKALKSRFEDKGFKKEQRKNQGLSFDLVRASVNLAVSSSLIAFATSYKLPLSTTYVTFMVAMGTSLADRAWGRESAVYRVSGVITVIGGWFFTALCAFTVALTLALVINWGGWIAVLLLIMIAIYTIYRTHMLHRKREKDVKAHEPDLMQDDEVTALVAQGKISRRLSRSLEGIIDIYRNAVEGLAGEKRKKLSAARKEMKVRHKDVKSFKKSMHHLMENMPDKEADVSGDFIVQLLGHLDDLSANVSIILEAAYSHVDNNHEPLKPYDSDDLTQFLKSAAPYLKSAVKYISEPEVQVPAKHADSMQKLLDELSLMRRRHLKKLRTDSPGTGASILYLDILNHTRKMLFEVHRIMEISSEFYRYAR